VLRAALRSRFGRRQFAGSVAAQPLGEERAASFFEPMNIPAAVDDLIGAMANLEPTASIAAAGAIQRFDRPVLLAWGDACRFFPVRHGQRLAESFPDAHLRIIPGAKTWVPVDAPDLLAAMLADFVPRGDAVS
jgi:pimeloyl-ACP methyl ester carboxylesterase